MNSRIRTTFSGFFLDMQDLNGVYIDHTTWEGPGNAPYEFIQKLNTPSLVTASYTLNFYDKFTKTDNLVHSVKREIKFWVVPNDKDVAKENVALIKQHLKSKKQAYKDILVVNNWAHQVYPKRTFNLPQKVYKFFNAIFDNER